MRGFEWDEIHNAIDQVVHTPDAAYILWDSGAASIGKLREGEEYNKEMLFNRALIAGLCEPHGQRDFYEYWCEDAGDGTATVEVVKNDDKIDADGVYYRLTPKGEAYLRHLQDEHMF